MSEPKRSGPIRRRVNSRRNSSCALPLDRLDWANWWTDRVYHFTYLHVVADDKTAHRVYCKLAENPRLAFRNGQLYWLIDAREMVEKLPRADDPEELRELQEAGAKAWADVPDAAQWLRDLRGGNL